MLLLDFSTRSEQVCEKKKNQYRFHIVYNNMSLIRKEVLVLAHSIL